MIEILFLFSLNSLSIFYRKKLLKITNFSDKVVEIDNFLTNLPLIHRHINSVIEERKGILVLLPC